MEEEKKNLENQTKEPPIVHDFEKSQNFSFTPKLFIILIIVLVIGIGSGYLLSRQGTSIGNVSIGGLSEDSSKVSKGTIVGSDDTKTFKDTAEGVLKEGGIDGEGAYHLVRPGGDSQNVYMTSSTVDLSKFVDRKIKVWGQTQKAQHAGWLMDVGRIEVIQ